MLKVTFLGTGTSQGIPVVGSDHPVCKSKNHKDTRLRSSILIATETTTIAIDCSPDFRQQLLANPIEQLHAIVFTHEHADHTMGLDDIRPFVFKQGDMPIYAHERVLRSLRQRFDYVFATENKYPGAPAVETYEIRNNETIHIGDLELIPIDCLHGNLQVFGFRCQDFAYLTDVKTVSEEEIAKLNGVNVLVINTLREAPHHSHFNLEEALNFITLVQPKKTYLTHISHLLGFHDEVEKKLPENVFLAYDNLELHL
ncbi:MAG: MBL fold metallo-hydrolase [Flavobacteriaceae bacterium]|nr:MBL fold metallo-hydrolase [Flavobacteriaceae bacterium]